MLGNWKNVKHESYNYTNCHWCFWYSHQRIIKGTRGLRNKEDEWRPPKLLYHWERPEYREETWKLEGTYCYLNPSERPSTNDDMKNFQGINNNNMLKPASVLENYTHTLLWDLDIRTDHLISTRGPDLIITMKKREFAKLSALLSRLTAE